MKCSTLPRFLIGQRAAILEIAHSRQALLCGLLFVISAGFAREYDGENLVHEPWHVLRPLLASLVSGGVLFGLIHLAALLSRRAEGSRPPSFGRAWGVFMGLYWMTAPLAWLYAIPYEQFASPVQAVRLNLWMLAIVAAWRVVLIVRVISVLYGMNAFRVFFLVMLFADIVAFLAILLMPRPVIDVMGGMRYSEREQLLMNISMSVLVLTVLSFPVWLVGALVSVANLRTIWSGPTDEASSDQRASAPRGLLRLAIVAVVFWVPILFLTQPAQMRRDEVERLFTQGLVSEGLRLMSRHEPSDFPPMWEPPLSAHMDRRTTTAFREPNLLAVCEAMRAEWPAEWVAERYLRRIRLDFFDSAHNPDLSRHGAPAWGSQTFEYAQFLHEFDHLMSEPDRRFLSGWLRAEQHDAPDDPEP